MGCRPVREAASSSAGSRVMVSAESPLGSPLLPVRAAPGGATGGGAIAGAANAVAPTSATIAQAHSRGARRSARPVAWSWLETTTALLSPQQETRNHKPTLKSRQPNSESVKEASGFVNRLSQNGNLTVMTNEAASPKSLDSKMDGSTAVPRAQNSAGRSKISCLSMIPFAPSCAIALCISPTSHSRKRLTFGTVRRSVG